MHICRISDFFEADNRDDGGVCARIVVAEIIAVQVDIVCLDVLLNDGARTGFGLLYGEVSRIIDRQSLIFLVSVLVHN